MVTFSPAQFGEKSATHHSITIRLQHSRASHGQAFSAEFLLPPLSISVFQAD
jgi:hypothetical protein